MYTCGNGGKAPHIYKLGIKWSFAFKPAYPRGNFPAMTKS